MSPRKPVGRWSSALFSLVLLAGPGAAAAEAPAATPSLRQSAARQVARARLLRAQDAGAPAATDSGRPFRRSF